MWCDGRFLWDCEGKLYDWARFRAFSYSFEFEFARAFVVECI